VTPDPAEAARLTQKAQAREELIRRQGVEEDRLVRAQLVRREQMEAGFAARRTRDPAREQAARQAVGRAELAEMDALLKAQEEARTRFQKREADADDRHNAQKAARAKAAADREAAQYHRPLTQKEIDLQVHNTKVDRLNQQRVDAALKAAGLEAGGMDMLAQAASRFGLALTAAGVGMKALDMVQRAATAIVQEFANARHEVLKLAEDFARVRGQLRMIANLSGRMPDEQFTREFVAGRRKTLLTHDEALQFEKTFKEVPAVETTRMSAEEQAKYHDYAGQFLARVGGSAEMRAKLMGMLPTFVRQRQDAAGKKVPMTARELMGHVQRLEDIVRTGTLDNAVAIQAVTEVAAGTGVGTEAEGMFGSMEEVAAMVNVMSFKGGETASSILRIGSLLRGFYRARKNPKTGGSIDRLLKRAGIKPEMTTPKALEQLFGFYESNVGAEQREHMPIDIWLQKQGLMVESAGQDIRGAYGQFKRGVFGTEMAKAAKGPDIEGADRLREAFLKTSEAGDRLAQVLIDLANAEVAKGGIEFRRRTMEMEPGLNRAITDNPLLRAFRTGFNWLTWSGGAGQENEGLAAHFGRQRALAEATPEELAEFKKRRPWMSSILERNPLLGLAGLSGLFMPITRQAGDVNRADIKLLGEIRDELRNARKGRPVAGPPAPVVAPAPLPPPRAPAAAAGRPGG
jgi:hypothetical protein